MRVQSPAGVGRGVLRVASHLAPAVLPAYAIAARRIGERLGRPVELVVAADYRRCTADLDHVCFVCSVPYVLLAAAGRIRMDAVAAPVLAGKRYAGQPVYYSDVVVRADSPYRTFADLAGTRWAYNEPFSHSGFLVVLQHLARLGEPAAFVADAVEAGFHDDALRMVLEGRADWAAIDSQVLEIWGRQVPSVYRALRVVEVLGPSPIQPVVVSTRRLGARARGQVRDALTGLHRDPTARDILRAAGIARFVPMNDAAYDEIRAMLDLTVSAGLLPTWWRPRWEALVRAAEGGAANP